MSRRIFGPDHDAFRASIRAFVAGQIVPNLDDYARERRIPRDLWTSMGELGLLGLHVPEAYGGSGADDYRFTAVLNEELVCASAAVANCFSIHYDVVVPYLVDLGTEEQKARWLPGVASGQLISAIAMTEPSGGSDLASLKTTATYRDGVWALSGSKTFITNGGCADLILVAARTSALPGARGITLFVVEKHSPGLSRGRKLDKVGLLESDTSEVFFDDVQVPESNLLGTLDQGFFHMMDRLPQERISAAVQNTAHVSQVLADTVTYVKQRKAFGQTIGSLQYNKFLLADLATRVDVTQSFVDQCVLAKISGELSGVDAAKAKWWSAEVQNAVIDACVQLHGGYGYMTEYKVSRAWRDARVTKIWAGTNEIMKELVGRDLGL